MYNKLLLWQRRMKHQRSRALSSARYSAINFTIRWLFYLKMLEKTPKLHLGIKTVQSLKTGGKIWWSSHVWRLFSGPLIGIGGCGISPSDPCALSFKQRSGKRNFQLQAGGGFHFLMCLGCGIRKEDRGGYMISILSLPHKLLLPSTKLQAGRNEHFVRKAVSGLDCG